jgi:hypothetical protein
MTDAQPNKKTYGDLNVAYDFFNNILFDGRLPRCLITMQHRAGVRGVSRQSLIKTWL